MLNKHVKLFVIELYSGKNARYVKRLDAKPFSGALTSADADAASTGDTYDADIQFFVPYGHLVSADAKKRVGIRSKITRLCDHGGGGGGGGGGYSLPPCSPPSKSERRGLFRATRPQIAAA
ncbi:hypothetical protein GWI33_004258 [Rhynchophorus ferrugineus]|uniref:Uncharacterized protein n=1 Tax=Rhynchophorus ferrugineus TaxID=354439 RepID=A0A834MIU0_RHYFE|nr:hypothetical protein GWI33_004258 [Rhynchophorus ferrugineus]